MQRVTNSNNVDHFVNLQHLEKPMEVIMGDGHSLKAAKCGMVELYIRSPDGKDRILKLADVLCVPELSYNLVSVPKATEKGVMVSFEDSMCHIFDKKKREIAMATKSGRLYYLEGIYQSVNTVRSVRETCGIDVMHI